MSYSASFYCFFSLISSFSPVFIGIFLLFVPLLPSPIKKNLFADCTNKYIIVFCHRMVSIGLLLRDYWVIVLISI